MKHPPRRFALAKRALAARSCFGGLVKTALFSVVIAAQVALCADTELIFNPASPDIGPFPSDVLTVTDPQQKTGRRVNLPVPPDCLSQPRSACLDSGLLNQLDGFSVEPRIKLCFSGPIAPETLSDGVFVIGLHRIWQPIPVERIFLDPTSKCAAIRPASVLEPGRRYVLAVTDRVRDAQGKAVKPSNAFKNLLTIGLGGDDDLPRFVEGLLRAVISSERLAGATLFTTMSATEWIRRAREFVNSPSTPSIVQPIGPPEGFPLAALTSFKWLAQTNTSGPLTPFPLPLNLQGVGRVSFGLYFSPNFIAVEGPLAGSIPPSPTGGPVVMQQKPVINPMIPGYVPISFHIFLPSTPKPASGYPVAIYGHGLTDSQFGAPTAIASALAQRGIATLAMEIQGHGFGPGSMVELNIAGAGPVQLPAPGRGVSITPGGAIGPLDGCILPGAFAARDCARQSAVDVFSLVRAITTKSGPLGQVDPSRIYYVGQSFGAVYGSLITAFEPTIRAAVMNVPAASTVDTVRLAQDRPLAVFYLGSRTPSLLNRPFEFQHPMNFDFEDSFVYRGKPPLVNTVVGAPQIQDAFEVAEWFNMQASPLAFAASLKSRPVLHQFAKGDEEVPNPTNSAFIRAAGGQSTSRYLRFDLAKAIAGSQLPNQPHRFLANPDIFSSPAQLSIALAAQEQVAGFFASNGGTIPDANQFLTAPFMGQKLFEIPSVLPDDLNFIRKPASPPPGF